MVRGVYRISALNNPETSGSQLGLKACGAALAWLCVRMQRFLFVCLASQKATPCRMPEIPVRSLRGILGGYLLTHNDCTYNPLISPFSAVMWLSVHL